MTATAWDPDQYGRFAAEREQPFFDLVGLLEPVADPAVVDLGCGDGRLTAEIHRRLAPAHTTGVDSSPEMLERAREHRAEGLSFEAGDLAGWAGSGLDVVLSNAALQWVGDHAGVLGRWRAALGSGGQLAVQVPANAGHPSHVLAGELGAHWLGERAPIDPVATNVRPPEWYATLLHDLGFTRQHVRLQVYGHLLPSSAAVVEWMKGTSLNRFKAIMEPEEFARFVDAYQDRLLAAIGDHAPYFYAFRRILLWGRI